MKTKSHEQALVHQLLIGKDVAYLARVLEKSKKTIYRWISGENKPCLETYKRLVELHAKNQTK
jgi:predicted transcriptional regulator